MAEVEAVKSQFLVRLSSLPVVHSALGYATHTYGKLKEVNPVIDLTLSTAEKSVLFANEKVQLIVVQDTKNLYAYTIQASVDIYNNYKSYGVGKINTVKQYGVDTAAVLLQSQYGKILVDSVNGALSLAEDCVDHILPPLDERDVDGAKKNQVLDRVTGLTNRIQRRVYKHALQKAQNLRKVTTNSIGHYASNEVINNAYTNVTSLWDELNKDYNSNNLTLSYQLMNSARFPTKQLVSAFVTVKTTIHVIPSRVNDTITTVYNYSGTIPSHFNNVLSTLYDFSTSAVTYVNGINPQEMATAAVQLKDRFSFEERVTFMAQTITQYPAVRWLVHQVYRQPSREQAETEQPE